MLAEWRNTAEEMPQRIFLAQLEKYMKSTNIKHITSHLSGVTVWPRESIPCPPHPLISMPPSHQPAALDVLWVPPFLCLVLSPLAARFSLQLSLPSLTPWNADFLAVSSGSRRSLFISLDATTPSGRFWGESRLTDAKPAGAHQSYERWPDRRHTRNRCGSPASNRFW